MTLYRYLHVLATAPDFSFFAPGVPAPQGSKRHVGRGVLVESSKKVKPWRADIERALKEQKPATMIPMDGPLFCAVEFWLPRPKTHAKTKHTFPVGPPDVDKLGRGALDPLTQNGVIHDDSRIIDLLTVKRFVPWDPRHALADDKHLTGALFHLWWLNDVDPYIEDPTVTD
ncbi:RusA family crossover junction endodeoxyribonuclease [Microbacterium sp. 77mftsu3.1]|uniref:RusA family crossover junction endodeoxyribonuclease n=1 Tax=Microbacterium sp. 77mftsu3.1 TaxID=1761802 RepID=UPI000363C53D|nr:RusA family crossover junction endodeoxyribonuclease [Microbacterium sp. 77mftsu3.1]SDH54422.1 Endodeoxyribonuclease RusA [Microbacterium sp. 77mftsu3.1]